MLIEYADTVNADCFRVYEMPSVNDIFVDSYRNLKKKKHFTIGTVPAKLRTLEFKRFSRSCNFFFGCVNSMTS